MRNSILMTMIALPLLAVSAYAERIFHLLRLATLTVSRARIGAAVPISELIRGISPPTDWRLYT